jgi:drug/metabolite transporter (DMT)-like permease
VSDPTTARPVSAVSAAPAAALRANARGIRFMVGAMACFIVNDGLVKVASASLPAGQLIFVRGLMACLLVFAVMQATGVPARLGQLTRGWVAGRAAIDAVATLAYLVSLFHLPLANATAINMASPLFIVALAVPLLGERVDPRRWAAIGIGFAGVLLVIQPRAEGFNAFALLCLFATLLHALRDFATRKVPAGIPSLAITLATAVAVTLLAGLISIPQGWVAIGPREWAMLATASVFLATGYHLIIRSVRTGDVSVVAPFRYSGLLFALVLGWAVWGDVPNAMAWVGIALLMSAGLYLIRREHAR